MRCAGYDGREDGGWLSTPLTASLNFKKLTLLRFGLYRQPPSTVLKGFYLRLPPIHLHPKQRVLAGRDQFHSLSTRRAKKARMTP